MKKCAILVFVLMLVFCGTASAMTAEYTSTQAFIEWLDAEDISFSYTGIDDNGYECLSIDNTTDVFSYTIKYFFESNNENASMRVWDVILFDESNLNNVLRTVNQLNSAFKYVNIYAMESDFSVNVKLDLIYRSSDVGDIVGEATLRLVNILDDVYEALQEYNK